MKVKIPKLKMPELSLKGLKRWWEKQTTDTWVRLIPVMIVVFGITNFTLPILLQMVLMMLMFMVYTGGYMALVKREDQKRRRRQRELEAERRRNWGLR